MAKAKVKNHLTGITDRARKIYAANPRMKWTDCIKAASGKKVSGKKSVAKKSVKAPAKRKVSVRVDRTVIIKQAKMPVKKATPRKKVTAAGKTSKMKKQLVSAAKDNLADSLLKRDMATKVSEKKKIGKLVVENRRKLKAALAL